MDRNANLEHALAFVIRRIEEEATRSGRPLTDEQRVLLNDLPRDSALPMTNVNDPEYPPIMVPRDVAYERLIALARTHATMTSERIRHLISNGSMPLPSLP
jgi:hypothetical protein